MKKIFLTYLFTLIIFLPSLTMAEQIFVIDGDSVGQTKCNEVLNDYKIYDEVKDRQYFQIDDFPKFDKYKTFEKYIEFYRGYEIGIAKAKNLSILSQLPNSDLAILIKVFCEMNPTKRFFSIVMDLEKMRDID